MPRGRNQPRIYTEMLRIRVTKEQQEWLEQKATEQNNRLADKAKRTVNPAMIVRALIQMQMDYEKGLLEVIDGED